MTANRTPLVSVIMPVYNGEKFLAEAIESILAQTFSDFELRVVDDASQDGSVEIIRSYEERDERVRLIQHERNRGQATALNNGVSAARGRYIAMMDSDDISLPDRLRKQFDVLEAHPEIDLVGACLQVVDAELAPLSGHDVPERHADIVMNLIFAEPSLTGAVVMMRRALPDAVGGYDVACGAVCDTDFFIRSVGKARFANLPERLYRYRRHDSNATLLYRREHLALTRDMRARLLNRLWDGVPRASADRLERLRNGERFGWRERQLLRRDLNTLVEALFATDALEAEDRPFVNTQIARRLEHTLPRLWQRFLHWKRNHFGQGVGASA